MLPTESFTYDPFGRLSTHTSNDGTVQEYTYDANSNITSYTLTDDDVVKSSVSYSYNKLNQLTSLVTNGITTEYAYDVLGNLTSKTSSNGVAVAYTYNKAGLPTNINTTVNGTSVKNQTMNYYFNGWKNYETDGKTPHYYYYNNAGQLDCEVSWTTDKWLYNCYSYDLRGNRTALYQEIDDDTDIEKSYTYDLSDRMISETVEEKNLETDVETTTNISYTYDERGNLTNSTSSDGTEKNYVYDRFYRLVKYSEGDNLTTYQYTADNLRASKTVNGVTTEYVWNGSNMAYEHGEDTENIYTYDITGVHMSNSDVYLKDGHGNIIGKHGTATGTANVYYDAFGNMMYDSVQPEPFGYCGEYYDSDSGLIYLRNRYYDSVSGRFITEDQHWNLNNMIYGDDQKAVKYAIIDGEKVFYDKNNNIIIKKGEKNKPKIISSNILNNNIEQDNKINFKKIERIPDICAINQSTNLYNYAINNPVMYTDTNGEEATGVGITAYVAFGIRIDIQGYYVWDDDGNKGIILSIGGGGGTPNAGLSGAGFTNKSADTIFDLEGMSVSVGGGVGYVGGDINGDLGGGALSVGISALPAELHGTVTLGKVLISWR